MTGAIYLLYFLTTIFGQVMVDHGLSVSGNVINVISTLCYAVVTFLFFVLFKPVSNSLSCWRRCLASPDAWLCRLGCFISPRRSVRYYCSALFAC